MSEWLMFNTKWTICSAISWWEQVTYQQDNDDAYLSVSRSNLRKLTVGQLYHDENKLLINKITMIAAYLCKDLTWESLQ